MEFGSASVRAGVSGFADTFRTGAKAGYTTAMAAGKSKFNVFDKPAIGNAPAALSWKYITASTQLR